MARRGGRPHQSGDGREGRAVVSAEKQRGACPGGSCRPPDKGGPRTLKDEWGAEQRAEAH